MKKNKKLINYINIIIIYLKVKYYLFNHRAKKLSIGNKAFVENLTFTMILKTDLKFIFYKIL